MIDTTSIKASSSTNNNNNEREPDMSSTKKNNNVHFGAQAHIATDTQGLRRDVKITTARVHDRQAYQGLTNEHTVSTVADAAYTGKPLQEIARGKGMIHTAVIKRKRNQNIVPIEAQVRNTRIAMPRKSVECPCGVIKHIRGHVKTQYNGLAKLHTQWSVVARLDDLFKARNKLLHVT
ncbi:MAG: transposase [Candidatus Absconditabacterales bacterium]|nr:transposase [Candidatus Absconditabacterales bacterium]